MKNDHRSGKAYTAIELGFIKANSELPIKDLTNLFNTTFGRYAEPKRIAFHLRKMGIKPNIKHQYTHKYTDEEREWLKANLPTMSEKELADNFNNRFNADVSANSLNTYAVRFLRVFRPKDVADKHRADNNVRYRKGDISIHTRGGRTVKVIKVEQNKKCSDGRIRAYWIPLIRYMYEQEYGKLPDGWVVIALNNDMTDCRRENMYAISPAISALMARNKWYSTNPEVTLTAIKLCELARTVKGIKV